MTTGFRRKKKPAHKSHSSHPNASNRWWSGQKTSALAIFRHGDIRFPFASPHTTTQRGGDFLSPVGSLPDKNTFHRFPRTHSCSHGEGNGLAIKTTTSHTNNTHVKRRNACKFDLPASKVYSCLSLELFKKSPASQAKPTIRRDGEVGSRLSAGSAKAQDSSVGLMLSRALALQCTLTGKRGENPLGGAKAFSRFPLVAIASDHQSSSLRRYGGLTLEH